MKTRMRLLLPIFFLGVFCLIRPSAVVAQATTLLRINTSVDEDFVAFNPCAGEDLHFTGSFHLLVRILMDASGGLHTHLTANDHALMAVGLTTGTQYRRVGADAFQENMNSADGFPLTSTFVRALNVIGPGSSSNLLVHQTIHVTINENGELTAFVENLSAECR